MKRLICLLVMMAFLGVVSLNATDYYVKNSGSDVADGLSDVNAWATIGKANSTLTAGDTVYILAGAYEETINPANSGSEGSPITYQNYTATKPVISGGDGKQGAYLRSGADWIIIDGIEIENVAEYGFRILTSHNIIRNCKITNIAQYKGIYGHIDADYNLVENCIVDLVGYPENGGNDVGNGIQFQGEHNLIENNEVYRCGHSGIHIEGIRNIIQGNYLCNVWGRCISGHVQSTAAELNVFQDNILYDTRLVSDGYPNSFYQGKARYSIFRRNRLYKCDGSGLHFDGSSTADPSYQKIYHNLIYDCGNLETNEWDTGIVFTEHDDGSINGVVVKNNLFYDNHTDRIVWRAHADSGDHIINNNHWNSDGDPKFIDAGAGDFRLKLDSPCIGGGDWLTTVTSVTGSGTAFTVADVSYFCAGFGLVTGDKIQLEGKTESVTITDINYTTNVITVDENVSWTQGDGVSGAFTGNAPDIGAYEYELAGEGQEVGRTTIKLIIKEIPSCDVVANPTEQTVEKGMAISYEITLDTEGGFNEVVTLSISGVPAGVTATFTSATIQPGEASILNVLVADNAVVGEYDMEVIGMVNN